MKRMKCQMCAALQGREGTEFHSEACAEILLGLEVSLESDRGGSKHERPINKMWTVISSNMPDADDATLPFQDELGHCRSRGRSGITGANEDDKSIEKSD